MKFPENKVLAKISEFTYFELKLWCSYFQEYKKNEINFLNVFFFVTEILIAPHLNATLIPPHARTSSSDAQSGTTGQQAETSTTGNPGGDVGTSQGATSGGGNA